MNPSEISTTNRKKLKNMPVYSKFLEKQKCSRFSENLNFYKNIFSTFPSIFGEIKFFLTLNKCV